MEAGDTVELNGYTFELTELVVVEAQITLQIEASLPLPMMVSHYQVSCLRNVGMWQAIKS